LKEGFDPLPPGFVHLSTPAGELEPLVDELERTIAEIGPGRIAAFIGEPVLGVGGMVPPPEGYWAAVQEALSRHGILLVLDEVVTAYGRTGRWFGAEYYGIEPDVLVTAKALTSGYVPMGAVLVGDRVVELLSGTPFRHGFTYNGHPTGAAVALANLDIIEREGLVERAAESGAYLLERLRPLADLPAVREVRGVGLMLGIELAEGDAAQIERAARADGVIVRATAQKVVLSPPFVIERGQLDRIADVLAEELQHL
jgi:putrescine aminotransferase